MNAFSEASLTVRDKAILAAINEKSHERIRKAYEKFSKELDEAQEKMSMQLGNGRIFQCQFKIARSNERINASHRVANQSGSTA